MMDATVTLFHKAGHFRLLYPAQTHIGTPVGEVTATVQLATACLPLIYDSANFQLHIPRNPSLAYLILFWEEIKEYGSCPERGKEKIEL